MELIDNKSKLLGDDLSKEIKSGSTLKIVASYFSVYAFEALKDELSKIEELQFIFPSPTFVQQGVKDKITKEAREYYIPKFSRENSLYGTEFEIRLRNQLTQKAIAKECAEWIRQKVTFKSNITDSELQNFIYLDNGDKQFTYTPIKGFTSVDLGYEKNNMLFQGIVKNDDSSYAKFFFQQFKKVWDDESMVKEFIEYKKDKVTFHTWQCYEKRSKTQLPPELLKKRIKDIRTVDIDRLMRNYDNEPRTYEEMRTLLNSVFKYSIASGIITHNPVTLVPFKRAKRNNRSALSDEQIKEFLQRLKDPKFDEIRQAAYVLYFFGIRPCELDEEARFENGFLICRNRKRKNGVIEYKKIPVPKQAQGLIDFDKPILFPYSSSKSKDVLKQALGGGLTPYNLRHTFASVCSEYVRPDVVEVWMGDSAEHLVGRVYVHFKDEFMKAQMDKVEFIN